MARIKCPECGNEISESEKTCPHCGSPVEDCTKENSPGNNMPMVECKSCGNQYEKALKKCPRCGKTNPAKRWRYIVAAALICIAIIVGAIVIKQALSPTGLCENCPKIRLLIRSAVTITVMFAGILSIGENKHRCHYRRNDQFSRVSVCLYFCISGSTMPEFCGIMQLYFYI